ncbi:MAG: glucose 1-dehydrogenase [Dehalococcoidia bacterium]|nr:glucose 1-dehydrogenase [Dehalococcoidia bacterium]
MEYPERLESVTESLRLDGRVAVVTGGSRGIGKATALGLAEVGANVVVVGRNLDSLEVVVQEIRSMGREALAVPAHVGKTEHLSGVVDHITKEMGRIDVLVNNAGTNPAMSSMLDLEERLWDSTMNLNLKGLVFLSQAVARVLKEGGGGSIINVTSADGFRHEVDGGTYAISKAGVIMATKVMAQEWARYGIRVNAVAPGHIHTRLGDSVFAVRPEYEDQLLARVPLGRIGEPRELVGTMVYLASGASSYTTGATFVVDGGWLLT